MNLLFDADGTKNKWWQVNKFILSSDVLHSTSLKAPIFIIHYSVLVYFEQSFTKSYSGIILVQAFSKRRFMGKELKD